MSDSMKDTEEYEARLRERREEDRLEQEVRAERVSRVMEPHTRILVMTEEAREGERLMTDDARALLEVLGRDQVDQGAMIVVSLEGAELDAFLEALNGAIS